MFSIKIIYYIKYSGKGLDLKDGCSLNIIHCAIKHAMPHVHFEELIGFFKSSAKYVASLLIKGEEEYPTLIPQCRRDEYMIFTNFTVYSNSSATPDIEVQSIIAEEVGYSTFQIKPCPLSKICNKNQNLSLQYNRHSIILVSLISYLLKHFFYRLAYFL